jgi:hypothetical protein
MSSQLNQSMDAASLLALIEQLQSQITALETSAPISSSTSSSSRNIKTTKPDTFHGSRSQACKRAEHARCSSRRARFKPSPSGHFRFSAKPSRAESENRFNFRERAETSSQKSEPRPRMGFGISARLSSSRSSRSAKGAKNVANHKAAFLSTLHISSNTTRCSTQLVLALC